jgi:voltage-gated sodium channel
MLSIILFNTFILSLDKYPAYEPWVEEIFSCLNIIFVFFFTTECILKIIGLGMRPFLKDGFNVFDLIVVISSIQGIYLEYTGQKGNTYFLILRTARVFRILKLFRIGDLRVLIDSITYTMPVILPYIALLIFFMYIFALVGMSFYAGKIKNSDGSTPREVYDGLGQSFLTIFQVLMGAEWRFIWYQHMMSCGMAAAFYYVLLIIIIGIIMLNLFLAIMLGNFDKARIFAEKKNVLFAFQELMEDETNSLQFAEICDAILGCCSEHVKYDLLGMKKPADK